jgi:hypothetical protein
MSRILNAIKGYLSMQRFSPFSCGACVSRRDHCCIHRQPAVNTKESGFNFASPRRKKQGYIRYYKAYRDNERWYQTACIRMRHDGRIGQAVLRLTMEYQAYIYGVIMLPPF